MHEFQKILSRLEVKNIEKIEKKKERNLVRRKTATGIPFVDEKKIDHHKHQPPSPTGLQENLKVVSVQVE